MEEDRITRYFTFKHRPGSGATEDECMEYVERAIKLNSALMQYEYSSPQTKNHQDAVSVTRNWNQSKKIKEGDYLFLRGGDNIHAVGRVIKPRKTADVVLRMDEIIKDNDHKGYSSDEYDGCIHFQDSPVFYEDLSDGDNEWGQRFDVDSWKYYNPKGFYAKSDDNYVSKDKYSVIQELKKEKAEQFIDRLKNGFMGEDIKLLENTKNLILTGAPGTGKTFLAKRMALKMLFGKDSEKLLSEQEKEELKIRCSFVQFHPSYDYTDFVEGLRPTPPDENSSIGFERKDGVFKEFCKRALINIVEANKTDQEFQKDTSFQKIIEDFIDESIAENTEYEYEKRSKGETNKFIIEEHTTDDNSFYAKILENMSYEKQLISKTDLIKVFEKATDIKRATDIQRLFQTRYKYQYTFMFQILEKLREKINTIKNIENVDIKKQRKKILFSSSMKSIAAKSPKFSASCFSLLIRVIGAKKEKCKRNMPIRLEMAIFSKTVFMSPTTFILSAQ
jgi:hypothetical protein